MRLTRWSPTRSQLVPTVESTPLETYSGVNTLVHPVPLRSQVFRVRFIRVPSQFNLQNMAISAETSVHRYPMHTHNTPPQARRFLSSRLLPSELPAFHRPSRLTFWAQLSLTGLGNLTEILVVPPQDSRSTNRVSLPGVGFQLLTHRGGHSP